MNKTIADIDKFHQTRHGKVTFGIAELLLAYLFLSLAIDSGSLWQYLLAILMFIGGLNNLARSISFKRTKKDAKSNPQK